MSNPEKDQAARLERARQIGLFRYMLIRDAADATLTGRQRGALVRKLAAEAHTDPDAPHRPDHPLRRWTAGFRTTARVGSTRWSRRRASRSRAHRRRCSSSPRR
jgi:hypothetical protein